VLNMDQIEIRHVVICLDNQYDPDVAKLKEHHPRVDVYHVATNRTDDQVCEEIDMALLDGLHCFSKLAFVGGDIAQILAGGYQIAWIKDTPGIDEELLRFWGSIEPVADSP
jgi:hypothetical protein